MTDLIKQFDKLGGLPFPGIAVKPLFPRVGRGKSLCFPFFPFLYQELTNRRDIPSGQSEDRPTRSQRLEEFGSHDPFGTRSGGAVRQ